ncbi:MAG TPA: TauD/TfdA family dioxygenase [Burkholderiales bacterium]|nr:TauD/TfdA family dioxygenase [Burkholderiales bacterium]
MPASPVEVPATRGISVHSIVPAIGAVINGVDLALVNDAEFSQIHAALMTHQVIYFRGQQLTKENLVAFAQRWGEPQAASESSFGKLDGFPQIDVLDYDATRPPYVTKEMWHTDFTGRERPTMGSVLYALEVPEAGGDTIWVSLAAAYDALSERMKNYLAGMRAEHQTIKAFGDDIRSNLWKDAAGMQRFEKIKAQTPVDHPVIRTHPLSGRKALFVNAGYTTRLLGVERKESDAVLNYLFDHLRTPEFQLRHHWRKGDLVVWDNRITQHYAVADYCERRVMYRITIQGDKPV